MGRKAYKKSVRNKNLNAMIKYIPFELKYLRGNKYGQG